MKGRVRRCAVICALAIVLGGCGGSAPATAEKSASVVRTDENSIVYFKTDKGLNAFFEAYNEFAEHPFAVEQIRQGNVRTKALIQTDNLYVELVNSANGLDILLDDCSEESEELYSVYRDFLKVMDDSLSDKQIEQSWSDIKEIGTGYLYNGRYSLNRLKMDYSNVEFQGAYQVKVHIFGPQYQPR